MNVPFITIVNIQGKTVLLNVLNIETVTPITLWIDDLGTFYTNEAQGRSQLNCVDVVFHSGESDDFPMSMEQFVDKLRSAKNFCLED